MSGSIQTYQSSHNTSQILILDQIISKSVNPQQQNISPEKKDNSSEKQFKIMNRIPSTEQCKKCQIEEECCQFNRQKTFFCHPVDQINPHCCSQKHIPEGQQSYQNSQQNLIKKPYYTGFSKSQFYTTQTFIEHAQSPRRRQISIKLMNQSQQNTLLNSTQNDNQKMTQSQQMIQQFDRQQLESVKRISYTFLQSMKSYEKQSYDENHNPMLQKKDDFNPSLLSMPRKSILRQIQQKIKNEKKSLPDKKERFSLKQFYSNKIISPQTSPKKKFQTEQLVQMILEKVQSQNVQKNFQQNQQTQKLVEILTLAIIPQFQRLENEYKGEMQKIQQKIQQITRKNSQNNLRESGLRKSSQKRQPLNNQSIIRINLNDDFDLRQSNNDELRDSAILAQIQQQRNEDFQRSEHELIVPTIKRTDSQDQLFITPYKQEKGQ